MISFTKKRIASFMLCLTLVGSTAAVSVSAAVAQPDLPNAIVRSVEKLADTTAKKQVKAKSTIVENYIYAYAGCNEYIAAEGKTRWTSNDISRNNVSSVTATHNRASTSNYFTGTPNMYGIFGNGSAIHPV